MCDTLPGKEFPVDLVSGESLGLAVLRALDSREGLQLEKLMQRCQDCEIHDFCQGGCLAHRYAFRSNAELTHEYCQSRHALMRFFKRFKI
jgi:radical SAM protein with 4Fe4S-binding SPASM domain